MGAACCVDQIHGGGTYPHEDCGQSCVVSIKVDAGQADSELLEEAFDRAHGDNPDDGTGGEVHVLSLAKAGIVAHIDNTHTTAQVLAEARANGLNRVMIAIDSDHTGYPSPRSGIGHWILWSGDQDYMQPVGGYTAFYADSMIIAASQNYHVVVDHPIGTAAGGVDQPMTPQERQQMATSLSILVRNQYLCRTSSVEEVQGTAADMVARGFDTGMWAIVSSDEAKAAAAKRGF